MSLRASANAFSAPAGGDGIAFSVFSLPTSSGRILTMKRNIETRDVGTVGCPPNAAITFAFEALHAALAFAVHPEPRATAPAGATQIAAADKATTRAFDTSLDIEADVEHVAVLDDVRLAFQALLPAPCGLRMRTS